MNRPEPGGEIGLRPARSADGSWRWSVIRRGPRLAPLLSGRAADAAVALVPMIYSVCAAAQAAAAAAAVAAARGDAPDERFAEAVHVEALREHLLALCSGAAADALVAARGLLADRRALATTLLGAEPRRVLRLESAAELHEWATGSFAPLGRECQRRLALEEPPAAPAARLPAVTARESLAGLPQLDAATVEAPRWHGVPAETGALARGTHPLLRSLDEWPLLARWVARLLELAAALEQDRAGVLGRVSAVTLAPGRGRAAVETARGTLLHEVVLHDRAIAGYAILAPTDWNFSADGPLAAWLAAWPAAEPVTAEARARQLVSALDPCVACRYEPA